MKIIVPATSANLGAGFDSIGIAVNLYLTVEILGISNSWYIEHDLGENIPTDKRNLLLTTLTEVLSVKNVVLSEKYHLKMTSEIPLARGLGSSSSVIIAGIELANQLAQLNLTIDEKLELAIQIEGHPDNVAPALLGNLVIATTSNHHTDAVCAEFPACKLLAFVPNYELKTTDSRKVLPKQLSYKEAVSASSIANVLTANLLTGDLLSAGKIMERDRFHEPYRANLVPELDILRKIGRAYGAYGTYLSGAGPTIMMLCADEVLSVLTEQIHQDKQLTGQLYSLEIDKMGLKTEH